jgi:hypothetical protein
MSSGIFATMPDIPQGNRDTEKNAALTVHPCDKNRHVCAVGTLVLLAAGRDLTSV